MSNDTPSQEVKVDYWMPLDIGQFLQHTMQLSTEEVGAYLLLLLRYWGSGPLPNDPNQLARTARMSPDAWSIAFASLSMFFQTGPDGLLHQKGADKRRAKWMDKRQKAHEKAQKAANARWSKHKAKVAPKTDAPSIASAMHTQCPTPLVQVQKQKQDPPTPLAAQGGSGSGTMLQASKPPGEDSKGETQAKPALVAAVAPAEGGHKGNHASSSNRGVASQIPAIAPGGRNGTQPPKQPAASDGRFKDFYEEVSRFYEHQNPGAPAHKWIRADRGALIDFLRNAPSIDLAQFKSLLHNRAASDINSSAPPRLWLRDLIEFSGGPLDRYKKQRAPARSL
jgi:uncharacterized protein YdaU (DUF1376 family)